MVATEVSTLPGTKTPDSNHHCDDVSMERTTLTVEEESGLELKPGGMGVGHISVSVAHHDSSADKGDIMQWPTDGRQADGRQTDGKPPDGQPVDGRPVDGRQADGRLADGRLADGKPPDGQPVDGKPADGQPVDGRPVDGSPADGGDRSTHKTTDQNMTGVNTEPAGQRSCSQGGQVFLTTTVDSASPEDAEPKTTECAAHQTSITSEDSKQREPGSHATNQELVFHESSEGLSISQEADIEATSCSGGELTVESSRFGVIGVSFQSSPSANTSGPKTTPSPQKR